MGLLSDLFAGRSLESVLARARARMATGQFEEAAREVEKGLERFPGAEPLRELQHAVRRAQASKGLSALKEQVERQDDPRAHEQLVALYAEVGMPAEALRAAEAYARKHPDRDTPHLLLGEIYLQAFLDDLQARDAQRAREHLLWAARLNARAMKARLLLAELCWCVGADAELARVMDDLQRAHPGESSLESFVTLARSARRDGAAGTAEALFARVEVEGALVRSPEGWPVRSRRACDERLLEERVQVAARRLVQRGEAEQVAIVRRNGTLVTHAGPEPEQQGGADVTPSLGVPGVASSVARSLSRQVRDLDLGAFKRCTLEGPFGTIVVGEVGCVVGAISHQGGLEPLRLWDRLAVAVGEASK